MYGDDEVGLCLVYNNIDNITISHRTKNAVGGTTTLCYRIEEGKKEKFLNALFLQSPKKFDHLVKEISLSVTKIYTKFIENKKMMLLDEFQFIGGGQEIKLDPQAKAKEKIEKELAIEALCQQKDVFLVSSIFNSNISARHGDDSDGSDVMVNPPWEFGFYFSDQSGDYGEYCQATFSLLNHAERRFIVASKFLGLGIPLLSWNESVFGELTKGESLPGTPSDLFAYLCEFHLGRLTCDLSENSEQATPESTKSALCEIKRIAQVLYHGANPEDGRQCISKKYFDWLVRNLNRYPVIKEGIKHEIGEINCPPEFPEKLSVMNLDFVKSRVSKEQYSLYKSSYDDAFNENIKSFASKKPASKVKSKGEKHLHHQRVRLSKKIKDICVLEAKYNDKCMSIRNIKENLESYIKEVSRVHEDLVATQNELKEKNTASKKIDPAIDRLGLYINEAETILNALVQDQPDVFEQYTNSVKSREKESEDHLLLSRSLKDHFLGQARTVAFQRFKRLKKQKGKKRNATIKSTASPTSVKLCGGSPEFFTQPTDKEIDFEQKKSDARFIKNEVTKHNAFQWLQTPGSLLCELAKQTFGEGGLPVDSKEKCVSFLDKLTR